MRTLSVERERRVAVPRLRRRRGHLPGHPRTGADRTAPGAARQPGLADETDQARRYRTTCIDALTSSLLTSTGLITSQDCPGEERTPVAGEILLLLTQATPAEVKG